MTARILFVCTGNSARSQMAEGLARALAVPGVEIWSAGTQPSALHLLGVVAMRERGLDITGQRSKHVDEVPGLFDYVITLCDDAARQCPSLPARRARLHWPLADPGNVPGDDAQRLEAFRRTRDELERRLREWFAEQGLLGQPALVEKVRAELARYEHPLFAFEARDAREGVEVEIRFRPLEPEVHTYRFLLRPREIEHAQFSWTFQKQLYDCLHDYVIEMFSRNPQRKD